jgi:hypothetical protein
VSEIIDTTAALLTSLCASWALILSSRNSARLRRIEGELARFRNATHAATGQEATA